MCKAHRQPENKSDLLQDLQPPDLPPDLPDLPPDSPDLPPDLQQPDLPSDLQPPNPQGRRPLHNVHTQTTGHRHLRHHFRRPPSARTIKAARLPGSTQAESTKPDIKLRKLWIPDTKLKSQIPEEGEYTAIKQHYSGMQKDHKRDQHYHVL